MNDPGYYMSEPKRQIGCSVTDGDAYKSLVTDLTRAGVAPGEVRVIHGAKGAEIRDAAGDRHGFVANLRRFFPTSDSGIKEHMGRVDKILNEGGYAVLVPAGSQPEADRIAKLLISSGADNILWWGPNTIIMYNHGLPPAY